MNLILPNFKKPPLHVKVVVIVLLPLLFGLSAVVGYIILFDSSTLPNQNEIEGYVGFLTLHGFPLMFVYGISISVGLFISYALIKKNLQPIQKLTAVISKINSQDVDSNLKIAPGDDIDQVLEFITSMFSKQEMLNQVLLSQNRELAAVNELSEGLTLGQGIDAVVEIALRRVIAMMEMDFGAISLYEQRGKNLILKASQGLISPDIIKIIFNPNSKNGFLRCIFEIGHTVAIEDINTSLDLKEEIKFLLTKEGFISWVCSPLKMEGEVIGICHLGKRKKRVFTSHDLLLLEIIGTVIGTSLSSAQLLRDLRRKEAELRRALHRAVDLQEDERKRLARELHDEVGQALTSILIRLKTLQEASSETMSQRLDDLRFLTSQTIEELRRIAIDLRPAALDTLGIIPALRWYIKQCADRTGLDIVFYEGENLERLSANQELSLYRIAQEGITNSIRHGRPTKIEVSLEKVANCIILIISDNGRGFNAAFLDQGLGLIGIRERVDLLDGNFFMDTAPGEGTILKIEIPITR
jgi:signal transduction histidine kinase